MKKIHICFVMPGCYPLFKSETRETFGGSEVELYNMAIWFCEQQGFQVDFLVGDYGQKPLETHRGIRLRRLKFMRPTATSNPIHKALKIVFLLKALLFQPSDIFITKTASEFLGWMVLVNKWLRGKKVVFRLGSDRDTDLAYWKEKSKRLYLLYRLGLFHCDQILCQSNYQQAQLYKSCRLIGKVIRNVFPVAQGSTYSKDYILWVSRCMALKRPMLFLEMARRIPEENFVMIMPVNQESKVYSGERITILSRTIAQEAQKIPNLKLIDFVPFNEIQSYYDHAKLFVNTSDFEGFPNSFLQACLGKTGILSLKVDPDSFIMKNNLGHCCEDYFEEAICFVKNLNRPMIHQLGNNAFEYVSQNHDIQKIGPKYVRLFEKLCPRIKERKTGVGVVANSAFVQTVCSSNAAVACQQETKDNIAVACQQETGDNIAVTWQQESVDKMAISWQQQSRKGSNTSPSSINQEPINKGLCKENPAIKQTAKKQYTRKSAKVAVYRLKTILNDLKQSQEKRFQ
ncbi:MAG: glycosyltransferase family 4 protein [Thermoclostridium sp.]|nr:glycosyltransferase family 4 protein [Thermoclostridium sp.]